MITQKFNNKKRLRLVNTTGDSPLNLNQRLAYSALLTDEKGLSQEGISSLTGLDAKGTVAAALEALAGHGLAERLGGRWVAVEPAGDRANWFTTSIKDKDWRRHFAYSKLYQLAGNRPLTLRQNVVYSILMSLASNSSKRQVLPQSFRGRVCEGLTYEYLSLLTGVGVKTVKVAINRLSDLKLVMCFPSTLRSRFALALLEPTDEVLSWFLDKGVEVYPGLIEFVVSLEAEPHAEVEFVAAPLAESGPILQEAARSRKAAKRSKPLAKETIPEPFRVPEEPFQKAEHEILPPASEPEKHSSDPLERHRGRVASLRLGQAGEIRDILLSYGHSQEVVARLIESLGEPGLPDFDSLKAMIHEAEKTFRKNQSEGRYASVRTSERLLESWLEAHRKRAVEKHEKAIAATDLMAWNQRLGLVGRAVLEGPWEVYDDPMTAPFDARLFAERIDGGEVSWDGWGRDYGQDVCRRALVGLVRVRIDEVLVEDGRLEPEDFEVRLRSIAPPRARVRKPTQDEMYEAWLAELDAA